MAELPFGWSSIHCVTMHTFIDEAAKNKHFQTDKGSLIHTNVVAHFTLPKDIIENQKKSKKKK